MKKRCGLCLLGTILVCFGASAETVDLATIAEDTLTVTSLSSETSYTNSGADLKTLKINLAAAESYSGTISGNLKVVYESSGQTVTLSGENTFTGGLDINLGTVKVMRPEALGTGPVALADAKAFLRFGADMVVANAVSLGNYTSNGYTAGLRPEGSYTVRLTGPLSCRRSWVESNTGSLIIAGGIEPDATYSSSELLLCKATGSGISIVDTPVAFANSNYLMVFIGSDYTSFDVSGCSVKTLQLKENGGVRLGVDNAFANEPEIELPYDTRQGYNGGRLDLNGHDASFGTIKVAAGTYQGAFIVQNSSVKPATFAFNQTAQDVSVGFVRTEGPVSIVKRGAKGFAVTNDDFAVSRTLEVADGTLSLAPAEGQRIADIVIVRPGAVLDLGGKTVSCRVLIPYSGATIQNGTLAPDCRGYVAAAGETGNFVVDPDLAVYYPFRSAEMLAKDFSCQGNADLLKGGAPVFVPEGRFGGCVYFDGTTYLTNNVGVFPASLPTGKTDNTLLAHVKGDSKSVGSQAIVTIGKAQSFNCNVMQAVNATTLKHFVWDDSNDFTAALPTGDSFAKDWHSVATTMAWNGDEAKGCHGLWVEGSCLTNGPILTSGGVVVTPKVAAESFIIAGHLNYQSNFKGWVDEVAVMKRALTEAEMQTYRDRGVPGLVKAENVHLMSAEGATLNVAAGVTSAWVEGPGAISTFGLTVTGVITNAPSLSGDLALADGARIVTDLEHPIVVEGAAELPGGGTIQVSQADFSALSLPVARTILQATSLSVADLANWSVEGLPSAIKAKIVVEGQELRLGLRKAGLVVVIR